MQQSKTKLKIGELQTYLDNDNQTAECLQDVIKFFEIRRIFKFFDSIKRCGVSVADILLILIILTFHESANIYNFFHIGIARKLGVKGKKNPYYDQKNNEKIDWRSLLYLIGRRFKYLTSEPGKQSGIKAIIFDDSPLQKTSKKTELVSRIHDHVTGRFVFGYKLLVCGYWDGVSFIPIDFSLHRERGNELDKARSRKKKAEKQLQSVQKELSQKEKDCQQAKITLKKAEAQKQKKVCKSVEKKLEQARKKLRKARINVKKAKKEVKQKLIKVEETTLALKEKMKTQPTYGLSAIDKRKQFKKKRSSDTHGYERTKEVDMKKNDNILRMLSRAVKNGFVADYVLVDSWFCCLELVKKVLSFYKKGIHLVAMAKMNKTKYTLVSNSRLYTAKELLRKYRKQCHRSRKLKAKYINVPVYFGDIRVNLFFVRLGRCNDWKLLLTTDLSLGFNKMMEIYHIRWSIETFFKEAKQYLHLGI